MSEPSGFVPNSIQGEQSDAEFARHRTFLEELFEFGPDAIALTTLQDARILRINCEFTRVFGYTAVEAVGRSLRDLVTPDLLEPILPEDPELLAGRKIEWEVVRRRKDGTRFDAHITGKRVRLRDEDAAYLIFRDISARKRSETLFARERHLLEIIAAGGSLAATLHALCRLAEESDPGLLVSILLLDRSRQIFDHGYGPGLPVAYVNALNGFRVGLGIGPCAAAAHLREQVISLDIAADQRWSPAYRALASAHELQACWSTPIQSAQGGVLGTFAVYPRKPVSPTPEQRRRIEQLTHLASIAIDHAHSTDALRRSEERYALAMEAAADGHIDWNVATGEFYVSPRMHNMLGQSPDAMFTDREDWVRRFPFHPEDRMRWEAALAAHFAGHEAKFRGDFRIVVNGEMRWLSFNFITTRDQAGNVVRWTGSIADVNDAKRDIAALLDAIPGLVAILTPAGEVDSVNKALISYCGQRLEAMRQWGNNGIVHAEDLPRVAATFRESMSSGAPYDFEARIRRFDGIYRWNQVRGLPFRDATGVIVRWYALLSDIDATKRAEEALRLSEERYALAMQASGEGHWDWKIATDEFYASPRYLELAGLPADMQYSGRADLMPLLPFHPDDRTIYEAAVAAHFAGETPRLDLVVRLVPNDQIRWLHIIGMCSRDADGKPVRWAGSTSDITERKRAEGLLAGEQLLLEMVARAASLATVLDALCRIVEENIAGCFCGISLADETGTRLRNGAAPNLPLEYLQAIDNKPMDRDAGPCCMAAAENVQVISTDIAAESRWVEQGWCDLALSHGLRSIWSTPIVSSADKALGTVAIYFGHPSNPTDEHLTIIERFTHLAAVAIERAASDEALRRSEAALRISDERHALAMEAAAEGHFDGDLETGQMFASARLNEIYNFPPQAGIVNRAEFLKRIPFHPDDRALLDDIINPEIVRPEWRNTAHDFFEYECRIIPRPGEVRWIRTRGKVVRDAAGRARRRVGVVADITERKRVEEALRQSEQRYQRAMLAAEAGFWDWEVPQDAFYASPRLLEMADLPPGSVFNGRADFMARVPFHPDDRGKWERAVKELFASGGTRLAMELRSHHGGETRWVHLSGMCERDSTGRIVRWTGSSTDVTARKLAEVALREQTERLQLGQAAMRMIIMDWNVTEDLLTWSDSPEWLRGPVPPGGSYPHFKDQIHPEDRDRFLATRRRALETLQVQTTEFRLVRTDGQVIWVLERKQVIPDGDSKSVRMLAAMFDITDRKRAESALRESQERYALAVAGSNDGIWDWDLVTDRMFVSARAQLIFGLKPGPTERMREEWHAMIAFHPEDHLAQRRMVEEYLSGALPYNEGEWRIRDNDGRYRWIRIRSICLRSPAGQPLRMAGSVSDIDAQKKAEAALRMSEERYALAMEASEEGHFDWNVNTDEVYASEHLKHMLDLPADPEQCTRGKLMASHIPFHPDDRDRIEATTREVLAGTALHHDFEYRLLRGRARELRWIHTRWKIFRNGRGEALRVIGVLSDITDRKRSADELRKSEARFRALTAVWSDWYWRQDEHLRFTYSTAAIDPPKGYPGGSSIGKTRWELPGIVPLSSSWVEHRKVVDSCQPFRDFEYSRPGPDGTLCYVSTSGTPIFDEDGVFRGYHGVGRNITEHKRVEQELRSRQEMLEVAQKAARAVAFEWRVGASEGENRWSPELEAMYGMSAGSYDGTYETWKGLIHADDWPNVQTALRVAHQTGDVDAEYRVVHSGGAIRWLQAKGRMFFDSHGKATRVVGFMLDVTDRRVAEEELQRMERQLRQAQRLEALGTLAGGIAHDFNNLLGAILGYGEMALRNVRPGSRLRRDVENIVIAGERGRALVERILAFSRSGVSERVAVHVEKVVQETLSLFAARLPRHIAITPRLQTGSAAVMGDSTQIHQVLMNLLTNAVQAMPSGGTIRVSLDRLRLTNAHVATTGTLAAREYVVLELADAGTGIPADIVEKIFDPFFTTKEVGVGTGLGLSLVHGIVTDLGGAIDVQTTVGRGSVFKVYLPLAHDVAIPGKPRKHSQRKSRQTARGRILVIDDEAALVSLLTTTLEQLGYSVVGFTSSAKAIEAFLDSPERFDAVITDESMPGASGSELILKMRAPRPTIPILLVTGYLSPTVIERARAAGATEVLKKPLPARQLQTVLERVLRPATEARTNEQAPMKPTSGRSRRPRTAGSAPSRPSRARH